MRLVEDRRPQVAHALGIREIEVVDALVRLAGQPRLDALAHHRPLLTRNGAHVRLVIFAEGASKRDIEIVFTQPVFAYRLLVAHLEMIDTECLREAHRMCLKRLPDGVIVGKDTAVNTKRHRDQRMTKQQVLDFTKRQEAAQGAVAKRHQVVAGMPVGGFDQALPSIAVKEGAPRMRQHIGVPGTGVCLVCHTDLHFVHQQSPTVPTENAEGMRHAAPGDL